MEMARHTHDKILTKSDIQGKLTVLKQWLDGHVLPILNPGSEATRIDCYDDGGRRYSFWLTVRPVDLNKPRYDLKPEFKLKEWHAFVVEKALQIGDRINLWLDDQGRRRITVVPRA